MRGFERAVEWLRPFVESTAWDFCIVWKLGDDPSRFFESRFIEWKDCCCSGGIDMIKVKKDELQQQKHKSLLCRDRHLQHFIRSKSCEALSQFPFVMSLYAGIHGEVAMSNQPQWIYHADPSALQSSLKTIGTQVLIPVSDGLIEFFASKHIPRDQNMIEFVTTQSNALVEPQLTSADGCIKANSGEWCLNALLGKDPKTQAFLQLSNSLEGSSGVSSPSIEHPPFAASDISQTGKFKQLTGTCYETRRPRCSKNVSEKQAGFVLDGKTKFVADEMRTIKKLKEENYHSKNLVTERNRRKKIKDGLFKLRSLVPNISKMDRAAILTDAMDYIRDLQEEEKKLRNELRKIEEEDYERSNAGLKSASLDRLHKDMTSAVDKNQVSPRLNQMAKMEVHVEVNQITKRAFLVKLYYQHKRGGFTKLMEGIHSLGLQVIDANVTTFDGKMLNIFKVERLSIQKIERLVNRHNKLDKLHTCFPGWYRNKVEKKTMSNLV